MFPYRGTSDFKVGPILGCDYIGKRTELGYINSPGDDAFYHSSVFSGKDEFYFV